MFFPEAKEEITAAPTPAPTVAVAETPASAVAEIPAAPAPLADSLGDMFDSMKKGEPVTGTPAPAAPAEKPAETPAVEDPHAIAPRSWTPKAAATWATLSPDIRAEVARRENDFHKGIGQYKEAAEFGHSFRQAMAPYEQDFKQFNVNPVESVRSLLAAQRTFAFGDAVSKTALLGQIAKQYGIALPGAAQQNGLDFLPPEVTDLQRELAALKSQFGVTQSDIQQDKAAKVNAEIEIFAKNPEKPFFNEVANDMANLIDKGLCKGLEDAYEQAVWANPTIRQKMIAKQQSSAVAAVAEATAARTAASKAALQVGAKATAQPAGALRSTPATLDASLSSAYDKLFAT